MPRKSLKVDDRLHDYILDNTLREPEIARRLREETAGMQGAGMQIGPEQGQFMGLLIELTGAKRTLEVGTFTGYSALMTALHLPEEGQVIACDVSEEWTSVGRRYWAEAGVTGKIDLRIGPGAETLQTLLDQGEAGSFDFAFIDADKSNYGTYYELALKLVRQGGLIAVDNVLWNGAVAEPEIEDDDTRAIRELNAHIHTDERVTMSLLTIGDGLTLARKR
ncbi:MAG: SAM-dependent methyltransferase [Rhodospirillaceae bacterium]|jgi:predicted O-methyltransferase YrrM|nr:SAM-dependent methyltransferase [Rhodospirillaceae bacterium]MBT6139273.1 SAM-dependent methyltransferase [Rhodospirillaceae bacterium]